MFVWSIKKTATVISVTIFSWLRWFFSEKTTLLRLLTVMGVIAFQRNPNCHLVQSLNSIQMAEDGCTSEVSLPYLYPQLRRSWEGILLCACLSVCLLVHPDGPFLAHLSSAQDELLWSLFVHCPCVRPLTFSNDFSSETAEPILLKFHMEPP